LKKVSFFLGIKVEDKVKIDMYQYDYIRGENIPFESECVTEEFCTSFLHVGPINIIGEVDGGVDFKKINININTLLKRSPGRGNLGEETEEDRIIIAAQRAYSDMLDTFMPLDMIEFCIMIPENDMTGFTATTTVFV